jgi:quercetin dioxygenase-like cupin family protein
VVSALTPGDLNVNVVSWPSAEGVAAHVNSERDVLIVVVDGSVTVTIDGSHQDLPAGHAILIPSGARRSILAGASGARYLSIHRRRDGLALSPS